MRTPSIFLLPMREVETSLFLIWMAYVFSSPTDDLLDPPRRGDTLSATYPWRGDPLRRRRISVQGVSV